jgi:hypothetical protein
MNVAIFYSHPHMLVADFHFSFFHGFFCSL